MMCDGLFKKHPSHLVRCVERHAERQLLVAEGVEELYHFFVRLIFFFELQQGL